MWRGSGPQFWFLEGLLAGVIIQTVVYGFFESSPIEYLISVGIAFALAISLFIDNSRHRYDERMLTKGAYHVEFVLEDGEVDDQFLQLRDYEDAQRSDGIVSTHLTGKNLMAVSLDLYNIKRPTELYFFLTGGNR
jgi:hypothetical protein